MGKADQSKHTPGKRNKDPLYKQVWPVKSYLYKSEFKSHWAPHLKGLVPHMFSDESNKLGTYIYITYM